MASKKIAFIKVGTFSHTNENVLAILKKQFSDFEIEVIDVWQDWVNTRSPVNVLFALKEYGPEILWDRKKFRACLLRTTYIFKKIKAAAAAHLSPEKYVFSFQTQSLFDAAKAGLPHFVYTDHTHLANLQYPGFDPEKLYAGAWIELEKTIYRNAAGNFTMSNNISRSLIEQYACDPHQVTCVYGGSNSALTEITLDNRNYGNKNILFVGLDWARKGGPDLAAAFEKVLKTHPDAQLTILGASPQLDTPNCHVVGRVSLAEVDKYYEKASIFCMPTRLEPFGIVFIEALSRKLPVVATRIGAIPDFVTDGENGYLVQPGDVDGLAQKLVDLLDNPERCRRFGEAGYQLVKDRYTWDSVGKRLADSITRRMELAAV